MVPQQLSDIFSSFDEDDFDLNIIKVEHLGDKFIVNLLLQFRNDREEIVSQNWIIEASGHRKNQISFDFIPFIKIKEEHPLLWEFTDTQCQLYFSGECRDSSKLFYDLYHTHKKTFGRYSCFNMSFTDESREVNQFQYSNGFLAEGSKKLMELYTGCLRENGLDFSILGERPATYWDGKQFVEESQNLKILFLGSTYIVARKFDFKAL